RQGWYVSSGGSSTPNMWVDGKIVRVGGFGSRLQGEQWFEAQYNTRRSTKSEFSMTADGTITPGLTGTIWVNVTALGTPTLSNLYITTVIARHTYGPYNGGNGVLTHHYTVRKMLPGVNGESLTISSGETKNFVYNFDLSGDHSGTDYWTVDDDMVIVSFIQTHTKVPGASNRYTAEILQSTYKDFDAVPNKAPSIRDGQLIAPDGATEDDVVTFKTFYWDVDDLGDSGPSLTKVYYKNATSATMSADLVKVVSGQRWIDGKWVQFKTTLGAGTYTYRFEANDGEDDALGDTGWNATEVTILPRNKVPQLSTHAFSPLMGDTNTVFRYEILYRDLDDEVATEAKIFINDVGYDMQTDSTGPWFTWTTYYYETTMSVGLAHRFYFTFSDGEDTARLPAIDASPNWIRGPDVEIPNNEPTLTTPLFTPDDGTRLDEFTFTIVYTDGEDDHPIKSFLYIDGVAYIMDPDGDRYDIGETFRKRTRLEMGEHSIFFVFNDGKNEVRFPVTGTLPGPTVVNIAPVAKIAAPKIPGSGAIPRYTPDDYVTFSAIGSEDPDSDKMTYVWTSSLDGPLSTLEFFDKPLSEGMHVITLEDSDEYGGVHSTTVSVEVRPYLPHPYVDSILANKEDPVEKDMVRYTATLANDGEIRAQGIEVRFLVDDVPTRTDTVTVELDKTIDVAFTWEAEEGTHILTIEVGDESKTYTEVVAANSLPEVTAEIPEAQGGEAKFETGKEIAFTLDASDLDGDDLTYLWDFGDGVTSTQANPTHTYSAAATYPVTLTVTDSRGGVTIKDLTVTITKPKSQDESPGFGALIAASAFIVAMLAVAVRRREM
ncbi:MAG: PKD domain-containing protein, partial [Thermoplasmata archaeon]|nr:PKD domain-containing protein [Thermoplasmata archaeon]